jgi:hypothetical protein
MKNGRPNSSRAWASCSACSARAWPVEISGMPEARDLARALHQDANFLAEILLASVFTVEVGDGAVHLAALHGEMDLRRALVAGDDLELESEQAVGENRVIELGRAGRLTGIDPEARIASWHVFTNPI